MGFYGVCSKLCRNKYLSTSKFLHVPVRNKVFKRPQVNLLSKDKLTTLQQILSERVGNAQEIDWKSIRKDIITSQKHINEVSVDAAIIGLCNSSNYLEAAKNYVDFLKNEGIPVNDAVKGRLMKTYYQAYKSGTLSDRDVQAILKLYDDIRVRNEIIDPNTCENLIFGLVATDQWKEALKLIDMIKVTCKPSAAAYSIIAARAFQEESTLNVGWRVLRDMVADERLPKCEVLVEYFRTIKVDANTFPEKLEQMLHFIGEHKIVVSTLVIKELQSALKDLGIQSSTTRLSHYGKCDNCCNYMQNISIATDEFDQLSSSFLDKVLIRRDVFQKSSPAEIEKFKNFVKRNGPFDCVIDGLNIAFSSGSNKSPAFCAKLVASVVSYLCTEQKRLLVIGRKHMQRWPKEPMSFIQRNAKVYFADDLTHDDPLLLYAALNSGPKTDFVSRDLMRSHAHLLGPSLKEVFRRWQQEHQFIPVTVKNNGDVVLRDPIKFNFNAHKVKNCWHIPYQEEYSATPGDSLTVPNSWLCVSQVSQQTGNSKTRTKKTYSTGGEK